MRKIIVPLASILLVIGSLVATLGTIQVRDYELRGYVNPTTSQELPFAIDKPGVNVELLQYDSADLRSHLARIESAGFRWIRQFAYWDEIEREQGDLVWTAWDQLALALQDFPQLEPLVVLMNSPAWAREERRAGIPSNTGPPQDLTRFAAFAGAFAERFGGVVDYYQIWDEPNLADAWGAMDPRPAEYVALLETARDAILRSDHSATIVAAGLAPTTETAGRNISDIRYLEALYAQGARELMDVVVGKPYGFSMSPLDRRVDESRLNFSRLIALREVMVRHGDARKPLWASNYGWNSLPSDWPGEPSIWGDVSESEQIRYSIQALDRAHREWPWMGAMFIHHWQPAADANDPQWGFALMRQDGAPSPLLQALEDYSYPESAQNGLFHALNPHARYSGAWQFSELGADIGWLTPTDSRMELDFYGTDVAMLLREDDYVAFLYPTVDDSPANATQKDSSGNAYIFLRSNSRGPEMNLAPVSTDLSLERHTLSAVADKGWDRWAIAGYAVSSGDLAEAYDRQVLLGAVATVLSILLCVHSLLTAPWRAWLPPLTVLLNGMSATVHLLLSGITSILMMLAMLWTWNSPRPSLFMRDEVNIVLALLTGGALYLSPSLVISLVLLGALFALFFHRLETGLILTLFWAPFFLFPVELHRYAFPMVEVMILVTAAAGIAKFLLALGKELQMSNRDFPILTRRLLASVRLMDLAVASLAALALVSLLWTQRLETAQTELRALIFEPLAFYVLLRALRPSRATLCRLFAALVVAGVLVSLIGYYLYFFRDIVITAEAGTKRLYSVYGSPNNVALLLGRAIPIALGFLLVRIDFRMRSFAGISLAIMFPAMLFTQSVGAILLGVPAGLIVIGIARFERQSIVPLIGAGVLGGAAFAFLTRASARFANAIDFSSGTNFFRLRLWESTLAIIRERPVTGIGMDQFLYYVGGHYLKPDAIWDRDQSHPHNFLLDFWTRLSVFGVLAFLVIQLLFWRSAISLSRRFRRGDALLFAMLLGLMGSMAGLLAHGLIDNSVFVIDLAFIFMFQLAALMRLVEMSEEAT